MTLAGLIQTFKDAVAQSNLLMELTVEYCVVCLGVALICGLAILLVYRFFYRGACFSANFSILLMLTALITTTIIMTTTAVITTITIITASIITTMTMNAAISAAAAAPASTPPWRNWLL